MQVLVPLLLMVYATGAADHDSVFFRSQLPPAEASYRMLFLSPTVIRSHTLAIHPLMVGLANRGHQVYLLSEPKWTTRHPNVTYLDHAAHMFDAADFPMFSAMRNPLLLPKFFNENLGPSARNMYNDPTIQKLYKMKNEFDLIVIDELAFMVLYPFGHGTTFAKFTLTTTHNVMSASFGNPLNPAYVSSGQAEYPQPYSTWHRVKNMVWMLLHYLVVRFLVSHSAEVEVASRFPSLPSLYEVEKNASLYYINTDPRTEGPLPLLPLQVPVAGISLSRPKPLPKDITEFLSGATPAVYVSFGSTFGHSNVLPQAYKDMFFSVFSKLPYKVIMKFEEPPSTVPQNVFIRQWQPQLDILRHPNVKAFISHGGVLSVHEATFLGVPVLGLPCFLPEHTRMIDSLVIGGQGLKLDWSTLTEHKLNESIIEIIENPSYGEKMAEKSRIFQDQREGPLDRAVYWTEYVAKYRGAPHFQSPAKHLSWIEVLNLDIFAFILTILISLIFLLICFMRSVLIRILKIWHSSSVKEKTS